MQPGCASGVVHLLAPSLHKLVSSDIATHLVLVAGVCVCGHAEATAEQNGGGRERTVVGVTLKAERPVRVGTLTSICFPIHTCCCLLDILQDV